MKREIAFWLAVAAAFFLFPGYLVLGSQVLIVALFAMSLDLILGYAGIVSLGHAASPTRARPTIRRAAPRKCRL